MSGLFALQPASASALQEYSVLLLLCSLEVDFRSALDSRYSARGRQSTFAWNASREFSEKGIEREAFARPAVNSHNSQGTEELRFLLAMDASSFPYWKGISDCKCSLIADKNRTHEESIIKGATADESAAQTRPTSEGRLTPATKDSGDELYDCL